MKKLLIAALIGATLLLIAFLSKIAQQECPAAEADLLALPALENILADTTPIAPATSRKNGIQHKESGGPADDCKEPAKPGRKADYPVMPPLEQSLLPIR